jgi:hypothetical protein
VKQLGINFTVNFSGKSKVSKGFGNRDAYKNWPANFYFFPIKETKAFKF